MQREARRYLYTDHNLLAIIGGIASPERAARMIPWGFLRGCFCVRPALGGLRRVGQSPARMEGGRCRFCHLCADVEVMVRGELTIVEQPGKGYRGRSSSR